MEQTFSELKKKDVINLVDGRHMGRVCDISFTFPENKVHGFTVTGCRGFKWSKQDVFLPIKCVVKIGQDAILVKFGREEGGDNPPPPPPPPQNPCNPCNPNPCNPRPNCPPPPPKYPQGRRDYDEYE